MTSLVPNPLLNPIGVFPEAFAIPNQKAAAVAEVLVNEWISRFGVSIELYFDQGRNL